MAEKRKDSRGRNLRDGEDQMKDGRYRYRYNDKDGKRQAVYSWRLVPTDKAPAGKREGLCLRDKEEAIEKDNRDGIDGKKAAAITLNDMFELYMAGKHELKQSTRTNYQYMYKNYVHDSLGLKKIGNIKYSDVKRFYNMLIREKGFKPNSMEIINTILHPTFTLAVRDGYIRTNPTDGAMQEIKKSHNWEKPKRHALTIEEQEAFINYMAGSDIYRHWLPLFTVFLGTGCRVGEIIGLRWKDCDFESGTISINHNLVYRQQDNGSCEMHITTPKTAAGCRTVPMLGEVRKALLQERKRQMKEGGSSAEIDGYTGFVFTNRFGYVHNPQTINRAIERIYTACNEEEAARAEKEHRKPLVIRHFSVHNLRHTFCTRFCENETNIKVIQEIMGHSDISTTMNIYAEATESKKRESFENLEGKIKIS
jgi:integrase